MADIVKKNTILFIETEVTEGTYVAPAAATSAVQTLADGLEISPSKQLLDRSIFNGSIGESAPRVGMSDVEASIPTEARANSVEGNAPEFDKLIRSCMGSRRQITTTTTTKASGNTGSVLAIQDADISKFTVGDIVVVKQTGAYHCSPITAVATGAGAATITLLVPKASGSFSNSVVVSKTTTYIEDDSLHPSLSISQYREDAILDKVTGARVSSMSLENFSTGQIPSMSFSLQGLTHDRSVSAPSYSPTYDTSFPPVVLGGGVYMNGTAKVVNDVTLSVENDIAFKTSIAAANGRVAGRATKRTISGSFNPYEATDSVDTYTKYSNNTAFSLFFYAAVPTATAGEFGQVIAFYLPLCNITNLGTADKDGLVQEAIEFSANKGAAGTSSSIFIGFI